MIPVISNCGLLLRRILSIHGYSTANGPSALSVHARAEMMLEGTKVVHNVFSGRLQPMRFED